METTHSLRRQHAGRIAPTLFTGFATTRLTKFLNSILTTTSVSSTPTVFTHQQSLRESRLSLACTNLKWQDKFLRQLGSISNTRMPTLTTHRHMPTLTLTLILIPINK
jgi:hypothetical protein